MHLPSIVEFFGVLGVFVDKVSLLVLHKFQNKLYNNTVYIFVRVIVGKSLDYIP